MPQLPIALTKIPIPALPDVSLSAQGALSNLAGNHTTVVDSISLTTHLLTAKGDLRFTMPSTGGNGTCEGEFKLELSDQGLSVLGSAITLGSALANSSLPPGTQRFMLRITGTQSMRGCQLPKLPIGGWCVTVRYSAT